MSAQNKHPADNLQYRPYPHLLQPNESSDFKASQDALIDVNELPYAANSPHRTFSIATPTGSNLQRAPSPPQSTKGFSSKQTDDETHESSYAYPLVVSSPEVVPTLWERLLPESIACRFYVAAVLIETTIDLAIEGELFLRVRQATQADNLSPHPIGEAASSKMPVYLSIFALAHVFQFVMAVGAVYARNTLQFLSLTVFNALFLLYAIIQIGEIRDATANSFASSGGVPINVLTIIIPIVIAVAEIAYIGLGWQIYNEFGWKVYKFLGADRQIKKMYAHYQIYECLVKFDVFFWVGFCVQFILLVLQDTDWEYYVTYAALPLSVVLLVEGHLAARHENKWMMATFMIGCVGAMVYFIYKLIKVLTLNKTEQYKLVWKSLTVFSVIAIALLIATFISSIIVLRNFGRGLKEALTRKAMQGPARDHRRAASTNLHRMSII